MTLEDVRNYYVNGYQFNKKTGMSSSTFYNWVSDGYVPFASQCLLEKATGGKLKTDWEEDGK